MKRRQENTNYPDPSPQCYDPAEDRIERMVPILVSIKKILVVQLSKPVATTNCRHPGE